MLKPPRLIPLAAALVIGGCTAQEPYERPGTWRATGANDANLRAMVANPSDLDRGVAPAAPARGEMGALAASRLAFPSASGGGQGGAAGGQGGQGGQGGGGGGGTRANPGGIPALPPLMGTNNGRR